MAAWRAVTALTATAAIALSSGCSRSTFVQNPYEAFPRSTLAQIAQVHPPEALRADLEAIVALHERNNPNPYLRVSKESIRGLADKLKASIDRPTQTLQRLSLRLSVWRMIQAVGGLPNPSVHTGVSQRSV